jgi:hypothetical protein
MLAPLSVLACSLYVVPLAALVALLRAESDDALDLGATIGLVFAADLLGLLVLTRLCRVEVAAFARTALLAALVAGIAVRRRRRGEVVLRALGRLERGDLLALALGGAAAFALSFYVSSHFWIWDREWHVPFTASLRPQHMPFRNVYDPHPTMRYHLAGDVFAASLQALSFAAMHASRALSLAHDLQAAIAGAVVALTLRALCRWPPASAAVGGLVPLLAGPMTLRAAVGSGLGAFESETDFNNFTLSFRPHCMVAGVLLLTLFAHVARLARRLRDGRALAPAPGWRRAALVIPLVALCSITDEISAVLAGLSLAGLWALRPALFGETRRQGALVVAGTAVAALLANLLLSGTMAPGGPIEAARWLVPRLPRFAAPGLPLGTNPEAWAAFFADMGPILVPLLIAGIVLLRDATTRGLALVPTLFAAAIAAGGLVLFLCFEVNGRTYEGHRFVTAARFLVPMVALLVASKLPRASLPSLAMLAFVLAGVFSSLGYVFYRLPSKNVNATDGEYQTSCREDFGARLGEPIVPTYVDQPLWYRYAGCRPIYAAGHDGPPGVVLAGYPKLGPDGFAKMDRSYFPPGEPARVVCAADAGAGTSLCAKARRLGACAPAGADAVACEIPASARPALASP